MITECPLHEVEAAEFTKNSHFKVFSLPDSVCIIVVNDFVEITGHRLIRSVKQADSDLS